MPKAKPKISDLIVPTRAVAEFFGVNPRTIQLWVKDGGCPRVKHGVFDLKAVFEWWQENIADISANGDESTQDIKRDYWRAKGEYERVRVDQLKGKLISRDEVFQGWAKRLIQLFAGLDMLKNRLPPLLYGKDIGEMQGLIGAEIGDLQEGLTKPGEIYPRVKIQCKATKKKSSSSKRKKRSVSKKSTKSKPKKSTM